MTFDEDDEDADGGGILCRLHGCGEEATRDGDVAGATIAPLREHPASRPTRGNDCEAGRERQVDFTRGSKENKEKTVTGGMKGGTLHTNCKWMNECIL